LIALVTGAGLTPDGLLGVVGTEFKDVVNVQRKGSAIEVQGPFLGPGKVAFAIADVESIHVATCGGNDQIHVNNDVLAPAILDGGDGDDHVRAGGGASRILGGEGADHLFGGPADDQVLGGAGNDDLSGGPGTNLLDGGPENDHCNAAQGVNNLLGCEN
jgi:Ca2+-binding RTX toxin-like protein